MKSKMSATMTSMTIVAVNAPKSMGGGPQPFSSTTPSITSATSWHLSVVSSSSS